MTAPTKTAPTKTRRAVRLDGVAPATRVERSAVPVRRGATALGTAGSVMAPPKPGTSTIERSSGRTRSAAAQRAYARRAQREGRAPDRATGAQDTAAGRASFVVLIMGLLVVGVATTLWLSTQAIADSYQLEDTKQSVTDLGERAAQLQREVTKAESASALAEQAKRLGMVPAGDAARLVVAPDGTVVVVGEPKPAEAAQPPAAPAAPPEAPPAPAPPADQPAAEPPAGAAVPPGGG